MSSIKDDFNKADGERDPKIVSQVKIRHYADGRVEEVKDQSGTNPPAKATAAPVLTPGNATSKAVNTMIDDQNRDDTRAEGFKNKMAARKLKDPEKDRSDRDDR